MGTLNSKNIALFDVAKLRVCHLFLQVFEVLDFTKPGSVFVTVQLATIQVSATKLLGFNAFVKGSTNVLGFILYAVARLPASSNDFTKSQSCSSDCFFIAMPRRVVRSQWYILTKLVSFEHTSNAVFMLPIAFGSTVITSLINQT